MELSNTDYIVNKRNVVMIYLDTYNTALQAVSGGVNIKTNSIYTGLKSIGIDIKLFDKFSDKLEKDDTLFIISPEYEHYSMVKYAQKKGCRIVVASVKTMDYAVKKKLSYYLGKLHIHNIEYLTGEILRLAHAVIAETRKEKDFIIDCYKVSENKITVIPNGVDDYCAYQPSDCIFEQIGEKKEYVLCVGRFDENKNQLQLIKALKGTEIPLVFIGGWVPETKEYYDLCVRESNQNMFFLGWLEHSCDLFISAYQNAKVVVLPSKHEIFGNALIEGGMAGANLVATDALPLKEWGIEQYCLPINVDNRNDIREKVKKAFFSEKLQKSRRHFVEQFSWDVITEKIQHVLEDV